MSCSAQLSLTTLSSAHSLSKYGEEQCPICTVPFAVGDTVALMPCCGKPFDVQCLAEWVKTLESAPRRTTCPFCRDNFAPNGITRLFPEESIKLPGSYCRPKLDNQDLFRMIARANRHHLPLFFEAFVNISCIKWPEVSPARLQHLKKHYERMGQLDDVLNTHAALKSPKPTIDNILIVPSKGIEGEHQTIRNGVALRLEFTSSYSDEENVTGSRDTFFVYADPEATVQDLAKVWISIWVRDSITKPMIDALFENFNFSGIPPLFFQRYDAEQYETLPWNRSLNMVNKNQLGQVVVLEEELTYAHLNPGWQYIWNLVYGALDKIRIFVPDEVTKMKQLRERVDGERAWVAKSRLSLGWASTDMLQTRLENSENTLRELETQLKYLGVDV